MCLLKLGFWSKLGVIQTICLEHLLPTSYLVEETGYESRRISKKHLFVSNFAWSHDPDRAHRYQQNKMAVRDASG